MLKKLFGKQSSEKEAFIYAPVTGKFIDLNEVDDPVFSQKMMGDGVAVIPSEGVVVAPFDGEVVTDFPTKHALGLKHASGVELLIHVGLDTVNLKGEGFTSHVQSGDTFKQGDVLLEMDLSYLKENAKSDVTPLVITGPENAQITHRHSGDVNRDSDDVVLKVKL